MYKYKVEKISGWWYAIRYRSFLGVHYDKQYIDRENHTTTSNCLLSVWFSSFSYKHQAERAIAVYKDKMESTF